MSEATRKIRAGVIVGLVFGVAWGTIVYLAFLTAVLLQGGAAALASIGWAHPVLFGVWVGFGFAQGLLISLVMSIVGRDRTVDTFPRWLGAFIGAAVGAGGAIGLSVLGLIAIGSPTGGIQFGMLGIVGAIGAVSTAALLTVARRGALPPAPAEPKKIAP